MKRIALFLATNIVVMVVIGLITSIFGLNRFIGPNEIDVATLMGYSLVLGFAGATIFSIYGMYALIVNPFYIAECIVSRT